MPILIGIKEALSAFQFFRKFPEFLLSFLVQMQTASLCSVAVASSTPIEFENCSRNNKWIHIVNETKTVNNKLSQFIHFCIKFYEIRFYSEFCNLSNWIFCKWKIDEKMIDRFQWSKHCWKVCDVSNGTEQIRIYTSNNIKNSPNFWVIIQTEWF